MTAWIALAVALAAPAQPGQEPAEEPTRDLATELARVVDVMRPRERHAAALELASDESVALDEWLTACRAFAPRGDGTAGRRVEEVELWVEGVLEPTPIAIYVPEGYYAGTPAPLLLGFHWTGGRGANVIPSWMGVADELGMLICAPSEIGPNDGYAFSRRELEVAMSALRWMRREYDVDENRVFATGISRGGHLTWEVALRHPDVLAGAAPMVGGPYFDVRDGRANFRYLENLAHLALHDLQGAQDQEGLVWNVRYAFERLAEMEAPNAHYHEFPDLGHNVDMSAVDWAAFFGETRRDPRPDAVVRCFAREGEGRAFWVEVLEGSEDVAEEFQPTIAASKRAKLDDAGMRRWMIEETDERTGRLAVTFKGVNRVEAKAQRVERFRLLLEQDMFDAKKKFECKLGSRRKKFDVQASKRILLVEFAERFDRTFLPVAEVVVSR